ncbi:hypothetical protein MMC14_000110 [Varicellaria rhodocarpa]|nr:hypothetical protein [Varicellaria rhodocarpa]
MSLNNFHFFSNPDEPGQSESHPSTRAPISAESRSQPIDINIDIRSEGRHQQRNNSISKSTYQQDDHSESSPDESILSTHPPEYPRSPLRDQDFRRNYLDIGPGVVKNVGTGTEGKMKKKGRRGKKNGKETSKVEGRSVEGKATVKTDKATVKGLPEQNRRAKEKEGDTEEEEWETASDTDGDESEHDRGWVQVTDPQTNHVL